MRKPGDNPERVTKTNESFPVSEWQDYASPLWTFCENEEEIGYKERKHFFDAWFDINPSNTLQKESAREEKDEKHICPLQLETIERLIHLYSNKQDTILTPFMGIGSEVYQAVKMDRKGIGFELKESYFDLAKKNLLDLVETKKQKTLF
jgi:DNA modification methylase